MNTALSAPTAASLPTLPVVEKSSPWARLHRRLMPDYNRKATAYWWVMVAFGSAVLAYALWRVLLLPVGDRAQVGVGIGIAMVAGLFPVRIPRSKNSFAAGEIFMFLLLLMHGPAAATLAAGGEALVGSWRTSKRWTSRIASPAMASIAMYAAGSLLYGAVAAAHRLHVYNAGLLLTAGMLCAVLDFLLNTLLITAVPYLKRNQWPGPRELFGSFGWVGITFAGSASVASLLFLTFQQSGIGVLMAATPIIAMMLATLHYYFRQQEADESVRRSAADASAREAELVATHVRELEISELKLQHIAFHDSLTGLPNRHRFRDQLLQALDLARAEPQRQFSLMFLDFDRFKLINDSLGHAVGDEFLVAVAHRIQEVLRPHDIVARLGGDEFAILAEDPDCERDAVTLADRLLEGLRQPFQIAGNDIVSSASIGITFSTMNYATPSDMLRDADTAMYKAKTNGKGRYALFDSALHTEVAHRLRLEGELRRALACGQLSVAYQPLFELISGRITGFEALARWNHPELGTINPVTFISVAEDAGLVSLLTDFMLATACAQLRQWQGRDERFAELNMHVNLSGIDIAHPGLVPRVSTAIQVAGLEARHLTLELTENILMERLEAALPALAELRRLGVGLSIDDFGTGYTSLRHLSSLPVTSLKIDRAFVAEMNSGANEAAVVRAIVLLGNSLGKTIIAEGIEAPEQTSQLIDLGCRVGQGFHLSRPLPAERVGALLDDMLLLDRLATVVPASMPCLIEA
ncbi:MAG TPA: EAL domain-containing protein [Burkholderiaceae bacterium]|jgi:diguanylate cyclase (GGDEF)-like protein|nr:EAL domain-containing protein [Burkholderiaceae bacterium]